MQNARIKFFNVAKGFGFVHCDDGNDAFLHVSRLVAAGIDPQELRDGDQLGGVAIELGPKGPRVISVVRLVPQVTRTGGAI